MQPQPRRSGSGRQKEACRRLIPLQSGPLRIKHSLPRSRPKLLPSPNGGWPTYTNTSTVQMPLDYRRIAPLPVAPHKVRNVIKIHQLLN